MPKSKKVQLHKGQIPYQKYFGKGKKKRIKKSVKRKSVEDAILKTLAYRSIFNYPLSFYQLSTFLLSKKRVEQKVLKRTLFNLIKARRVGVKLERYYLYKTETVSWKERANNSKDLFEKAENLSKILSKIPWIRFIGVTGSLAAYSPIKNDDMDFFFITQNKRLWLSRGFTFVILKILGDLRSDKDPDRKVCPNIFVDENNLSWNKKGRNVYVAHEIAMIQPLYDKNQTYFKFLEKNNWIYRYFGNLQRPEYKLKTQKQKKNPVLNYLENLAYKSQLSYMKSKITKEITTKNMIHFKKIDNTDAILDGYAATCSRLDIKPD